MPSLRPLRVPYVEKRCLPFPCSLLERFERKRVALVSVAESLATGSAAGRLVINIMTAVSQWEREAIGERTRDAMSHKRRNGERVGNNSLWVQARGRQPARGAGRGRASGAGANTLAPAGQESAPRYCRGTKTTAAPGRGAAPPGGTSISSASWMPTNTRSSRGQATCPL